MTNGTGTEALAEIWTRHNLEWRDCGQVASLWESANNIDQRAFEYKASANFWDLLAGLEITLLVSREYEHLLMALSVVQGQPVISYFPLPHPSGIAIDRQSGSVHIASTRNPNQIFEFRPVSKALKRDDIATNAKSCSERLTKMSPLMPVSSRFYPGCLYLHDLAFINGTLHGNAVGLNSVISFPPHSATYESVWHPRCVEIEGQPVSAQNHIQLNSIAAGDSLESSFFTASSAAIETLRPGDPKYSVNKRGVVFDGRSRDPVVTGLTRPHSARLFNNQLWVDNSGYGELVLCQGNEFTPICQLPGWTRGLCFVDELAFVGISRVIPRFSQYAPGLDAEKSQCGICVIDTKTGAVVSSITWPAGNQIFAIDWCKSSLSGGLPFSTMPAQHTDIEKTWFYSFSVSGANSAFVSINKVCSEGGSEEDR